MKTNNMWTVSEDKLLLGQIVNTDLVYWWKQVTLTGRSKRQCRDRFNNHLDPRLNKKVNAHVSVVRRGSS